MFFLQIGSLRNIVFPTVLKEQLNAGDQTLNLQSGMGVSAILLAQDLISIISDLFTRQLEGEDFVTISPFKICGSSLRVNDSF